MLRLGLLLPSTERILSMSILVGRLAVVRTAVHVYTAQLEAVQWQVRVVQNSDSESAGRVLVIGAL